MNGHVVIYIWFCPEGPSGAARLYTARGVHSEILKKNLVYHSTPHSHIET